MPNALSKLYVALTSEASDTWCNVWPVVSAFSETLPNCQSCRHDLNDLDVCLQRIAQFVMVHLPAGTYLARICSRGCSGDCTTKISGVFSHGRHCGLLKDDVTSLITDRVIRPDEPGLILGVAWHHGLCRSFTNGHLDSLWKYKETHPPPHTHTAGLSILLCQSIVGGREGMWWQSSMSRALPPPPNGGTSVLVRGQGSSGPH